MKRIQVAFNQVGYDSQVESLNTNLNKIKKCKDSIFKITGKDELISLAEVEEFITTKTKFKNVLLSATLLEVGSDYEFLEANLDNLNLNYIDFNNNIVTIKNSALEAIKEANTTYLSNEFINEYNSLLKACVELNKLNNPTSSNYLSKDYNGKFKVNVQALHNSNRI